MTRNHFSKKNGPYFVNDGLSMHKKEYFSKPPKGLFYFFTSGFVILLLSIGIILYNL